MQILHSQENDATQVVSNQHRDFRFNSGLPLEIKIDESMDQKEAIKKAKSIRRKILKAIKNYDSPSLLKLIDVLDFESHELLKDLPTWTSERGGTWKTRLQKWRDEARDAYECF